jgi:hypothetical protein
MAMSRRISRKARGLETSQFKGFDIAGRAVDVEFERGGGGRKRECAETNA